MGWQADAHVGWAAIQRDQDKEKERRGTVSLRQEEEKVALIGSSDKVLGLC